MLNDVSFKIICKLENKKLVWKLIKPFSQTIYQSKVQYASNQYSLILSATSVSKII